MSTAQALSQVDGVVCTCGFAELRCEIGLRVFSGELGTHLAITKTFL